MASSVEFQNVVPSAFFIDPPATSGKSILNKYQVEINPVDQTEYDTDGNKIIQFYISSEDAFLSGPETYIQFKISLKSAIDTYDAGTKYYIPYYHNVVYGRGGYYSLFRNIKLYAADSGEIIEKLDYANEALAYADYLNAPNKWDGEGKSTCMGECYQQHLEGNDGFFKLTGTKHTIQASVADYHRKIIGEGTLYTKECYPGMMFVTTLGRFIILQVDDDLNLWVDHYTCDLGGPGDLLIAYVYRYMRLEVLEGGTVPPNNLLRTPFKARAAVGGGNNANSFEDGQYLNIRVPIQFFRYHLPLFAMKGGLRIEMELDREPNVFYENVGPSRNKVSYMKIMIKEVTMKAMMIIAHNDVTQEYLSNLRSSTGLLYRVPGMRVRRVAGLPDESSTTVTAVCSARSVRRVACVIRDSDMMDKTTLLSGSSDSLSTWIRSGITKYTFRVGSDSYPYHGVKAPEFRKHVAHTLGIEFINNYQKSKQFVYTGTNSTNVLTDDDNDFIMCCELSRDPAYTGDLTGLDLSVLNIELEITRSAPYNNFAKGTPMYFFLIEYDSYVRLTPQGVIILQ